MPFPTGSSARHRWRIYAISRRRRSSKASWYLPEICHSPVRPGFTSSLAHQPAPVISRMFWMFILLPIGIWLVALLIAAFYPLGRARMAEIRTTLEARRGRI